MTAVGKSREAEIGSEIALPREAERDLCRCEKFPTRRQDIQSRSHGDENSLFRMNARFFKDTSSSFNQRLPDENSRVSLQTPLGSAGTNFSVSRIAKCCLMPIFATQHVYPPFPNRTKMYNSLSREFPRYSLASFVRDSIPIFCGVLFDFPHETFSRSFERNRWRMKNGAKDYLDPRRFPVKHRLTASNVKEWRIKWTNKRITSGASMHMYQIESRDVFRK